VPLDSCIVVKLGGSIITDRDAPYTLNPDICLALIRKISAFKRRYPHDRIVLILGGGSYGHTPVREFCLEKARGRETGSVSRFSRLTIGLYKLVSDFMDIAFDESIELHPFQLSAMLTCSDGKIGDYFSDGIEHCLRLDGVPLMTGGSVFDDKLGQIVFGSDRVPELFARMYKVNRCIFVSDVQGVMNHIDGGIFGQITSDDYASIFSSIYSSRKLDVTGGMRGKVEAAMRLTQIGVESVICSASTFLSADEQDIVSGGLLGTKFRPSM
jgi:isopentenyl phosphate kinase